jgi:hypothetical protein
MNKYAHRARQKNLISFFSIGEDMHVHVSSDPLWKVGE